ncbi:MAM and LDL-receptor class A domain-containing protein 1 isoform X1 [Lingula anatina]|uniref:MAM and LDL-receptor class A domain-containing protein 1 isoform X1 n=1 Tax=Lingula anatina TaxID=7574 RepID=A0A1S3IYM9_LINAN|nr:MAM and LDL-receptor class A domain-containing protein 1 isoform X1 [Lingula anatina]|eukprot:XP_013403307.1 MAM and LDL-receptor class A domain-containing protein 1 isoform X1 [Lingula anatina]
MGIKMINTLLISAAMVLSCAKNALGKGATCNFDGSFCGYSLSADEDRFKWQQIGRNKGLPTEDHTVGTKGPNGQFLTVKWTSGTAENQKAIITSPRISQANAPCSIGFYYYMNSDQIALTAHLKTATMRETKQIWAHQVRRNMWTYSGPINITSFSNLGDFQVLIQAQIKPGNAFSTIVSIDDITFTGCGNGAGPVNPTSSTTLKTTTTPSTTSSTTNSKKITTSTPTSFSGDGVTCNFDGSFCGYLLSSDEDRFKWQQIGWNQGLPTEDHTFGSKGSNGQFLTVKWRSGNAGNQKAIITSPRIPQTNVPCSIGFYYYMNSDQISLTAHLKTVSTQQTKQIWAHQVKGNGWTYSGPIDITSLSNIGYFQVLIQAQIKPGYAFIKVVSVDDVTFSGCGNGTGPVNPTSSTTVSTLKTTTTPSTTSSTTTSMKITTSTPTTFSGNILVSDY